MACSFLTGEDYQQDESFNDSLHHIRHPNQKEMKIYQAEFEKIKDNPIISLPRGGVLIKTSIGNIQLGIPPETVKDSLNLGLDVPTHFIIPSERFDRTTNQNVAEFEFPAYFNFFVHGKKINLICDMQTKSAIRNAFQETLCGPVNYDKLKDDFHFSFPLSGIPDFKKERIILSGAFSDPCLLTEVDSLLSFSIFDKKGEVELTSGPENKNIVKIERLDKENEPFKYFKITDNGKEIAMLPDQVTVSRLDFIDLEESEESNHMEGLMQLNILKTISDSFTPPDFGVTILGNSHGFDPCGHTTGFVIWCLGSGIMVDPPPFSNLYLKKMGINPQMISAIILTHCHADHDAGVLEKILLDKKIEVITTRTIMNSLIRKYSNLIGIHKEELRKLFKFRPVIIGSSMNLLGASFTFFYAFHVIPCIGFSIKLNSKSLYFSGDTFYSPTKLKQFYEWGFLAYERYQQLTNINFDKYDLILHEAGVPPIHTSQEQFDHFSESTKDKLFLVHIAKKDLKKNLGLKIAQPGVGHTLVLIQQENNPQIIQWKRLELLSKIDIFEPIAIKSVRYLLDCLEVTELKKGEMIFPENSIGNKFYIVEHGLVKIVSRRDKSFVSYVGPGDYFGEVSLIDQSHVRHASAYAEKDCGLLSLEKHDFEFLFGDEDGQGEVLKRLKELSEARKKFAITFLEKNQLFNLLEKNQKVTLETIAKEKSFQKGSFIWKKGERLSSVYILKEGECLYSRSSEEEVHIKNIGTFIGETLLLQKKQIVNSSLKALTDCVFIYFEGSQWIEFLCKNPGIKFQINDKTTF